MNVFRNCKPSSLSIHESLNKKTILVLGAHGFIARIFIAFLLSELRVKKLYLLLRDQKQTPAYERFQTIYAQSKIFKKVRQKYADALMDRINISIITGDITKSYFGLPAKDYTCLLEDIDFVINFIADVRFTGPLDDMLNTNTRSVLNIIKFVLDSKKSKLMHISTCYVSGMKDGFVPETVKTDTTPIGIKFTAEAELDFAYHAALEARQKQTLFRFGMQRVQEMGWPNTYTYSKALSEILVTQKLPVDRFCIFRPSIVESTAKHPFPGWSGSANGTLPLLKILSMNYPFIVAKPEICLDVTPVDYVVKGILIAASALMQNKHATVYQCATSHLNPLTLEVVVGYIGEYFQNYDKTSLKKISFLNPQDLLSESRKFFAGSELKKPNKINVLQKIMTIYQPFIYDYKYCFQSENLFKHHIVEDEFMCDLREIDWREYWVNIHLPSLFPEFLSLQGRMISNGLAIQL